MEEYRPLAVDSGADVLEPDGEGYVRFGFGDDSILLTPEQARELGMALIGAANHAEAAAKIVTAVYRYFATHMDREEQAKMATTMLEAINGDADGWLFEEGEQN